MKNRLLKNGSVSRRCWLPLFAFLLKKIVSLFSKTRKKKKKKKRESVRGRASLFCVLPNWRRKVVVGRKRVDAKKRKKEKNIYM